MVRLLTGIVIRLSVFALGALVPRRDLPVSATDLATDGPDRPHLNFDDEFNPKSAIQCKMASDGRVAGYPSKK
jgi:hypothetical protein